ncbi:MAG: hypothetical protein V1743_02790 [Nanoarchaeota archaeon]
MNDKPQQKPKAAILKKTAKEYFDAGEDELKKERYNSALVLYFKSLVALIDLYIFEKTGDTPSSHTNRFRILRNKFPDIYDILDKDFPFYQNSYIQILGKDLTEVIKDDAKTMANKTKVNL